MPSILGLGFDLVRVGFGVISRLEEEDLATPWKLGFCMAHLFGLWRIALMMLL